jgi:hypothetical protein
MTGSSPIGLVESRDSSAAPRVISAPCRNKPAGGDSLDFDAIGGLPFCFYRFTSRPFMERLREVCLAAEGSILKLLVADHYTTPNPSHKARISMAFDPCRGPQVTNQALSRHTFISLL